MEYYIEGVATYLPEYSISNKDINKLFKIPEEWIEYTTGNTNRYYSFDMASKEIKYSTLDLSVGAVKKVLTESNCKVENIDAIVLSTGTPDNLIPATVNLLAEELKINKISTYQILAGCSGAIQAIDFATALLSRDEISKVLVVGVDSVAKFIDLSRDFRSMKSSELINYVLFGDGAGAAIISKVPSNLRIKKVINQLVGLGESGAQKIKWFGYIPDKPEDMAVKEWHKLFTPVEENYLKISELVPILTEDILSKLDEDNKGKFFLPPQLNKLMTDKIILNSNYKYDDVINVVDKSGNCGNALPYFQLEKLISRIKSGETAVCVSIESSKWVETGMLLEGC